MDDNTLLLKSLLTEASSSPDKNKRDLALSHLEQFCDKSFHDYALALSNLLANESDDNAVRINGGMALKNALTSNEFARKEGLQERWKYMEKTYRDQVKQNVLRTLVSPDGSINSIAGQIVAAIADIELSHEQWPELIGFLHGLVSQNQDLHLKASSIKTVGYICEATDPRNLSVVQADGIRSIIGLGIEDPNLRLPVLDMLPNSFGFFKDFDRNDITLQCERIFHTIYEYAKQDSDVDSQLKAFQCLVEFVTEFYQFMGSKLSELIQLTVGELTKAELNEDVSLQAVELWSAVCDVEWELNEDAHYHDAPQLLFTKDALPYILPVLLNLLTKQEEGADEDDWNVAIAAATCLNLFSQCVGDDIIEGVYPFVESNIRDNNPTNDENEWRRREAAVMAFGSILEGPTSYALTPYIQGELGTLVAMMDHPRSEVRDTVLWTIATICEFHAKSIDPNAYTVLLPCLLARLPNDTNSITRHCCSAIFSLAEQLGQEETYTESSPLSLYFEQIVSTLWGITERNNNEGNCKTSAYEAIAALMEHSANDCIDLVRNVSDEIINRITAMSSMQAQIQPQEFIDTQSALLGILTSCTRRLPYERYGATDSDRIERGDRIMKVLLSILTIAFQGQENQATVAEDAFIALSAFISVQGVDFTRYAQSSAGFVEAALEKTSETQLLLTTIGVVCDVCISLESQAERYYDFEKIMNLLARNLMSPDVHPSVKPVILSCFGDVALALGEKFQPYLSTVVQVLLQAGQMRVEESQANDYEAIENVNSIHESTVEAYVGIVRGLQGTPIIEQLLPYLEAVFNEFLARVAVDRHKSDTLTLAVIGFLTDLAESFMQRIQPLLRASWIDELLREAKTSRSAKAKKAARRCREMIKQARQ